MNQDPITSIANSDPEQTAQQFAGQVRDQAQHVADQIREQAGNVAGQVRDQAEKAIAEGGEYVRQNPWPAVLGAAGVGLLVGFALAHRREPSFRSRYLDDPLDHARDVLSSLLAPVGDRLHREYGHARSAIEDVADSLKGVDPAKQASRVARKLRFW